LITYSLVSRQTHDTVSSYVRRRSKLDGILSPYFTPEEVLRFRELQSSTGTLISGRTALRFFDPAKFHDGDDQLDLYVNFSFRKPVTLWLQSIGYRRPHRSYVPGDATDYSAEEIDSILTGYADSLLATRFHEEQDSRFHMSFTVGKLRFNVNHNIKLHMTFGPPIQAVIGLHCS